MRLAGRESTLLSTVQILSGAIYVTMQLSAAASLVSILIVVRRQRLLAEHEA